MATNTSSSKRPATTLRCGNIKATIWQNISEKGPVFATTFSRPYPSLGQPPGSQIIELVRIARR